MIRFIGVYDYTVILTYTSLDVQDIMELLAQLLPAPFLPMAEQLVQGAYDASSISLLSVSAVTAVWSASRGILGLKEGFNSVYHVREKRSYLVTRGISMVYTVLFVGVLVLTLVIHVFGTTILDYLRMTTDPFLQFLMDVIDLRFILLLVLQTAMFSTMYAALPHIPTGHRPALVSVEFCPDDVTHLDHLNDKCLHQDSPLPSQSLLQAVLRIDLTISYMKNRCLEHTIYPDATIASS